MPGWWLRKCSIWAFPSILPSFTKPRTRTIMFRLFISKMLLLLLFLDNFPVLLLNDKTVSLSQNFLVFPLKIIPFGIIKYLSEEPDFLVEGLKFIIKVWVLGFFADYASCSFGRWWIWSHCAFVFIIVHAIEKIFPFIFNNNLGLSILFHAVVFMQKGIQNFCAFVTYFFIVKVFFLLIIRILYNNSLLILLREAKSASRRWRARKMMTLLFGEGTRLFLGN